MKPRDFKKKQKLTADWVNNTNELVKPLKFTGSGGVGVSSGPGGWNVSWQGAGASPDLSIALIPAHTKGWFNSPSTLINFDIPKATNCQHWIPKKSGTKFTYEDSGKTITILNPLPYSFRTAQKVWVRPAFEYGQDFYCAVSPVNGKPWARARARENYEVNGASAIVWDTIEDWEGTLTGTEQTGYDLLRIINQTNGSYAMNLHWEGPGVVDVLISWELAVKFHDTHGLIDPLFAYFNYITIGTPPRYTDIGSRYSSQSQYRNEYGNWGNTRMMEYAFTYSGAQQVKIYGNNNNGFYIGASSGVGQYNQHLTVLGGVFNFVVLN